MATMLLIVVLVFIFCYSIAWGVVISAYNTYPRKRWLEFWAARRLIETNIFFLLIEINSSVNILIYCFKDKQFRNVAWKIMGFGWKKITSHETFVHENTTKETVTSESKSPENTRLNP